MLIKTSEEMELEKENNIRKEIHSQYFFLNSWKI